MLLHLQSAEQSHFIHFACMPKQQCENIHTHTHGQIYHAFWAYSAEAFSN